MNNVKKQEARILGTPTAWDPASLCTCNRCGQFAADEKIKNSNPKAVNYICPKCRIRNEI